jgi:hypothetical protein
MTCTADFGNHPLSQVPSSPRMQPCHQFLCSGVFFSATTDPTRSVMSAGSEAMNSCTTNACPQLPLGSVAAATGGSGAGSGAGLVEWAPLPSCAGGAGASSG